MIRRMIELKDSDRERVYNRILAQLPGVECIARSEDEKLRAIGSIVEGILADVQQTGIPRSSVVRPSILPSHDDVTIDFLARQQKILKRAGYPDAEIALRMEQLEHAALIQQREDRPRY